MVLFVFTVPATGAMRLQERSLYVANNNPGATSAYTLSFRYMSPTPVGSVDLLFCTDPIPYHPCDVPAGLDVSNAALAEQLGETGFTISTQTTNRIVMSRTNTSMSAMGASYRFVNMKNPTETNQAFSIRMKTHVSQDATGLQIDFGSVRAQISNPVEITTQVPPMLIFCVAEEVMNNCAGTNDNYYTDMGDMSDKSTLTAQSQMAVGTNASGGFAITANGYPLSAGSSVVSSPEQPTESRVGENQFGINLVENNTPSVGKDPEGQWANAVPAPDYSVANKYKYVPGDVVAFSPNVSLMKKFTVSYIINTDPNLRAGVYTTTITYMASGRF